LIKERLFNMGSPLSGNFAELGLDDILRIISVSRKTGILTVKAGGREAVLQCRDGLVVRAASTGLHQSLGELMVHNGVVDASTVRAALSIQQKEGFRERIGTILCSRFKVNLQLVEKSVRQQIYNVIMNLFSWNEGDFDFVSRDDIETVDAAYLDPIQLIIEQSELIEELTSKSTKAPEPPPRKVDTDFEATFSAAKPPGSAASTVPLPSLVVIDDDSALVKAVANAFSDDKLELFPITRSEEALLKIDSLFKAGSRPVVLLDLIMPRMDGTGVLGGIELLRLVRGNFPDLAVIMMTDFRHEEAQAECADSGCECISKPRRGNVESEEFNKFVLTLRSELKKYITF